MPVISENLDMSRASLSTRASIAPAQAITSSLQDNEGEDIEMQEAGKQSNAIPVLEH